MESSKNSSSGGGSDLPWRPQESSDETIETSSPPLLLRVTGSWKGSVEISSSSTVLELKGRLQQCNPSGMRPARILVGGVVLKDEDTLRGTGVTGQKQLLVMWQKPAGTASPVAGEDERGARLHAQSVIAATERVAGGHHRLRMDIFNQDGVRINVSEETRRALSRGIMLHDMGNGALRGAGANARTEALAYFTAAEQAFRQADPNFLDAVDNYPFVCLNICWLLFLQWDLSNLQEAERLLAAAEAGFSRAHGGDLSRLKALKGQNAAEITIYPRLHLLQGIVCFLRGDQSRAIALLLRSREECRRMSAPPHLIQSLIHHSRNVYGEIISPAMARRALRAGQGDINGAIAFLEVRRQRQERIQMERGIAERARRETRERRRLERRNDSNQSAPEHALGSAPTSAAAEPMHATASGVPPTNDIVDEQILDEIAMQIDGEDDEAFLDESLVPESLAAELYLHIIAGAIPLQFDFQKLQKAAESSGTSKAPK
jgi:hypothetical protein